MTVENLLNPNILDFINFEQNIETVVIMYHLNRGFLQYHLLHTNLNGEINKKSSKLKLKEK